MKLLIVNGPNLNMLGIREKHLYGDRDYDALCNAIRGWADELGAEVELFQSNHEGAIVDRIQQAYFDGTQGIVINPAAYTHTSVALRDALLGVAIPFIEVHISNVHAREPFRHHSYLSDIASGVICGFGTEGYEYALRRAVSILLK
jgi:3-dehydroquinate dehydratase-2